MAFSLRDPFGIRAARSAEQEARIALEAERKVSERMAVRLAQAKQEARQSSGPAISGGQFNYEENPKLKGSKRWPILRQMECDPRIDSALQGAKLPLVMAEWKFLPASEQPIDVEIADFCSAVLLHAPNDKYGRDYWTLTPWKAQRLPEILACLQNGFSAFHKSWRVVDGKRVYDRLTWLEPKTVDPSGWKITQFDEIEEMKRTFVDPSLKAHAWEPILARDLALYPWNLLGARFEGTPWIRSMYGAWMRKDALLKYAVMWAAKIGNPPPVGSYPPDYPAEAQSNFESFLADLRRADDRENLYYFGPQNADGKGAEITFAGAEHADVDRVSSLVQFENQEIAHPGAQKSQTLGETETGSRAVGGVQQAREMQLYRAIADVIIEWEMYGVGNLKGVVEDLVEENFGDAQLPRLTVEGIDPTEKDAELDRVLKAKPHLPSVPAVTRKIATLAGFSAEDIPDAELVKKAEESEENSGEPPAQNETDEGQPEPLPGTSPDQGEGDEPRPDSNAISLATSSRKAQWLAPTREGRPQGGFRYPNRLESEIVSLATVSEAFRIGESDLSSVLKRVNRTMIDDINARLKSGKINRRNIPSQRKSKPRGISAMREELASELDWIGQRGVEHCGQEIQRAIGQKVSLAAAQTIKQKMVAGYKIAAQFIEDFEDEVRVLAEISIDKIWERLIREGTDEYLRLYRQGFEGQELWDRFSSFMDGLSEKPVDDLARMDSTVAYNQGRDLALITGKQAGLVDIAVRSEVLDDRTCQYCQALDGTTYEIGSDDYYRYMPPAECEGGERCRGFYVVLPPGEEAA